MRIIKNKGNGTVGAIFIGLMIIAILIFSFFLPATALYFILNSFGIEIGYWISFSIVFLFLFTLMVVKEIFG